MCSESLSAVINVLFILKISNIFIKKVHELKQPRMFRLIFKSSA